MNTLNATPGSGDDLLEHAPLARVLIQVRWPDLANFNLDEVSAGIGRRLGDDYPLVSRQAEMQVTFSPAGPQQQESGYNFRFSTPGEDWTISVGRNFLALETTAYAGHKDFFTHLRPVLQALHESASIPFTSRIGYRYTNRVVGSADLKSLDQHFVPAVLGGLGAAPQGGSLVHSITESVYRLDETFLLVRSAQVGPNESIDPTLPPVGEKSWILDLDAYVESKSGADPESIIKRCQNLSSIASSQFHSVVTKEFYERYA